MRSFVIAACAVVLTLAAVLAINTFFVPRSPKAVIATAASPPRPKQLWTCGMHPQVIQDHPGNCPICHMKLVPLMMDSDTGAQITPAGSRKILYYWDPMLGPSSIAHAPGKSAMGMDLVPVYEDEQSAGPTLRIDPAIVQNMGVQTVDVSRGPLTKTVRAVGILEVPEPAQCDINLKINGWITKLFADQDGMHIHKGEVLFDLYSPDLQVGEEELIAAVKSLHSLDAHTSAEVRSEAEGLVASAKQKLQLWDVADQEIDAIAMATQAPPAVAFRSPASGDVIDKSIVQGSAVQAGSKLMRIEDHSTLWLDAQVYENDLPLVTLGQTVDATTESEPGKTYSGPITFIYPHLDHMTRTATVRVTIDNPQRQLRPGMYAMAKIRTQPVADAVWVPREAVIDTGDRQIAFVAMPQGRFQPRKVRMGLMGADDRVQILEGLAPGEKVVTSGEFLLDVESRTTEAINKLRQSTSDQIAPPPNEPAATEAPTTSPASTSELMHPMNPSQK